MARSVKIFVALCFALTLLVPSKSFAEDDFGLIYTVGADKKLNKKWTVGTEIEFRTRNDARTADRWSGAISGSYKINSWLKAQASYIFLYTNNRENLTYNPDGSFNNWRPSYWSPRHRFTFQLTGSMKLGRFDLLLRERWQYTYRPEKITERYDFDNGWWEDQAVHGKGKNVLRSRFQVEYNIPKKKITPFANVELFTTREFEKVRFHVGADYTFKKKHDFKLYYRYQAMNDKLTDATETNIHMIGLGYTFKF